MANEITDPEACQQRIDSQKREIQDFNTQIGKLNGQLRELEEGKATIVKSVERDEADLAAYRKDNGIASG